MTSPSPDGEKTALGPRNSGGKNNVKAQVKPFTKESLERLENKTVQLVREYGFQPRRKLSVEDGSVLPPKYEPFPPKLYGRPLEEIDNFIYDEVRRGSVLYKPYFIKKIHAQSKSLFKKIQERFKTLGDQTFCVVSKRFQKNYIHRFTATNAFFVFSPWNAFRRSCIFLSTNQYFDYVVMVTILINCVFLARSDTSEEAEYIFLAIYTAEMIIKSIAKGFILNKYTYLRNPWNWLDFVVITSGYATIGMDYGNLAGLRTFRVLRALKTISILPGLKTIINALLHSFKQLAEVMTLTIFCLMVFALFALQVYMGELRNKCVKKLDELNVTDLEWMSWISDEENWLMTESDDPVICGNVTGSRHCPEGYFCVRVGENPNHGYTSFDNFLWSMLTTFQLITLDYWENVYNMVLSACGPFSVVFFTVVVFFGSFYLINLMLAVVALSYEEEAEITNEERKKDLTDHRDDSTFSFDPTNLKVKQLDKNNPKKKIDSRKGVLLASYTRKKTRRRKKKNGTTPAEGSEPGTEPAQSDDKDAVSEKSRTPSPRNSTTTPQSEQKRPLTLTLAPAVSPTPAVERDHTADTLHPINALGPPHRGQLLASRHPSSNSDSNNRESSLDDSGVVDDHEEGDVTSEEVAHLPLAVQTGRVVEPVTVSLSAKEIRVIKCNGVSPGKHMYTLPSDYLSHIVVLDDLPDRNCDKCTQCCMDYDGWLRFQSGLYQVVKDPLFELLITLCIVLNTLFLALEHHGMSQSVEQTLDIGNKVFTSIFSLECFLKLLALSKEYFTCGWNIFDLIVVSASLLDLAFELVDGLSVLRGLRLLRVLKLAQSWTTMKVLLSIIISTIGALGNLTFVLVIVIYIFAVIGMQLFSKDYTAEVFHPDPVPRWNFNDFFHSFMMIFRILCGEWIEPLWDCMRAEASKGPESCFLIFLPALVMGNFMVLNLFLALLLNSFNSEELKQKKEPDEDDKEAEEFNALLKHHVQFVAKLWRRCWKLPDPDMKPPTPVALFHRVSPREEPPETPPPPVPPRARRQSPSPPPRAKANAVAPSPLASLTPTEILFHRRHRLYDRPPPVVPVVPSIVPPGILFHRCRSPSTPPIPPRGLFVRRQPELLFERRPLPSDPPPSSSTVEAPTLVLLDYDDEEVGEESKLARSFERIRSIVRKKRRGGREKTENEQNMRLEEMVREVMTRHKADKGLYSHGGVRETIIALPDSKRQEGMTISKKTPEKQASDPSPQVITRHPNTIRAPEVKQYSQSVQENLNRRAEVNKDVNKRFSLVMQRAIDQQDGIQDLIPDPTQPGLEPDVPEQDEEQQVVPEPQDPETEALIHDKQDVVVVPEGAMRRLQEKRFSLATTQQMSSKDEESIEMDLLGRQLETESMLPGKEPKAEKQRPWHALVSYVDELTVGGRRDSKGRYVDGMGSFPGFGRNKAVKVPQDCFHPRCYRSCGCCHRLMTTKWGCRWRNVRTSVLSVVDTPVFEWFILVLIFASSITLCFEDIYLDENVMLKRVLYWTNLAFCALFSVEMVLKWIALGFWKYFTSFWTVLDFIIVFVSIFSLLIEENENLKVLRSLRTLRALRPLRAISRWQGMRIVVNALMYAIPSIFNVLLVCLVFWLIFSIMGVQFFGGKFYKCVDAKGELVDISEVDHRENCTYLNYTWINSKISFDNVGTAYLALFQVATFEGWMEVMADAVDARGVDLQPVREANLYAYLYFVIFIVCGSFFTLNLFIGVIIDNFNMLKKKYEGGVLEMFLTESQKHYYTAMKKLGRKKPQKVIKRPLNQFIAMFYDLSNSRRFEIAIFVLIFLNMLTMGIEHYGQPHAVFFILEVSNAFFTTVFGLEASVKIIGLRLHYFTVPWNLFDFILVLASIFGILMEDIMVDLPVSPTLLRVVRVFRIGRILRLIKAAKGIRKLLFALVVSLPALFNIGALLALITFIYAIIGMSVFGHVRQTGALDDMVNFETFGRSMQLLFRLMTAAGWNDVLESLMIQPPNCDPYYRNQPNGDCGHPIIAITYFVSFIIISYMIVINMYIAIILENFNQAHQEEEVGIVEDDLEMFYIRWSKYDPHATQFISFTQLSDFIASLDPPLGIPKPNVVALVSFNLPIARGNKIHCLDILHALVKYVLGHVEESDDFRKLQDQMDIKFKKQFPTRKELEIVSSTRIWKRQDKACRLIQSTFRDYLRRKRDGNGDGDLEDEMTQTSSPGGWQSRLSAFLHVHRGSRCSSRKSSRASDASELSDLGGAWLNLPLLFLSNTHAGSQPEEVRDPGNGHVSIMVSEPSPEAGPSSALQHQHSSPRLPISTTDLPLEESIAIGLRELRSRGGGDVSILVTEPSPDSNKTSPNRSHSSDVVLSRDHEDNERPLETCTSESNLYSGKGDMHPSAIRPGGGALSLLPTETTPLVSRSSESARGGHHSYLPLEERHPSGLRPGGGVLSLMPSEHTKRTKTLPDIRQRPMRLRRSSDATIVHVLVHRESEEDAAS